MNNTKSPDSIYADFRNQTTFAEQQDERFVERVSICIEDGDCSLADAIAVARVERRERITSK